MTSQKPLPGILFYFIYIIYTILSPFLTDTQNSYIV